MQIPYLLRGMENGESVTLLRPHTQDATIALSARRAKFRIETKKVLIIDTHLSSTEGIVITKISG